MTPSSVVPLEAVATDFHRLPFAQLVDIQFGNLRRYLQPLDAGQADNAWPCPPCYRPAPVRGCPARQPGRAPRRRYRQGRAHRTAIQLGLQRLVFHAGVGQVHFGDLAILALPLRRGSTPLPAGPQVPCAAGWPVVRDSSSSLRGTIPPGTLAGLAQLALGAARASCALRRARRTRAMSSPRSQSRRSCRVRRALNNADCANARPAAHENG